MTARTNRLAKETSPYLRQHQYNPVDWYPWGEEAFARARRENKPILLSIGYSACHWCHVMEKECFENEEIARKMNELFVNVKVDREERPDIDHIYMTAVQMLTGRGGWPLTVFLRPDGTPFYGGTYFPPVDRYGMPGFPRVLDAVARAWKERPDDVEKTAQKILEALRKSEAFSPTDATLDPGAPVGAAEALARAYDERYGGLGQAPKFPNVPALELFLRAYDATRDAAHLRRVTHTLRCMARGGIYDQLGGGFHRYSVDERWLVPHFEKMLYDNAQLAPLYLEAHLCEPDQEFVRVARETLDYLLREMRHPEGGFFSTQDADSEGEEGKFFVWTADEIREVVGADADVVCRYFGVTEVGNFEGKNVLHVSVDLPTLAKLFGLTTEEAAAKVERGRRLLFEARERRVKPERDDKVLTAWNGLAISAFARAASILGDERYLEAARSAHSFVRRHLWEAGELRSVYRDGVVKGTAHLDDHAFLGAACLDLHEATGENAYLEDALELGRRLLAEFYDREKGGFYFTSEKHERLILRSKAPHDGATPSGNSMAARTCLRLYHLVGEPEFLEACERTLRLYYPHMVAQPFAFAHMLGTLDMFLRQPKEIVVVGNRRDPATQEILRKLRTRFDPNRILRLVEPGEALPPLLEGKGQVDGKPTVYVCHRGACSPPATEWDSVRGILDSLR
ncbi:MAG: thioredoxin domain-containing protein [Candidatus Binatia bacterium]|nr:MAG: thioredoxin domain-containing protein [Candidatus Binatia bacterium]